MCLFTIFSIRVLVITAKICLVGKVRDVDGVQQAAEVINFTFNIKEAFKTIFS